MTPQSKPTEIANKLAVSANRRGMPSRKMKFFATEIEADLLRFSIQQSEELVRVLEFCDKVISEWFKHGNIEPYSQEQLALDSMRILIKNVLAAHCANQQEDSK